ncbi:peptidylprolyl isomerase [Ammoniphilus resinae]|uniref:peptidylprolyl isomerase n=1 Tax=Ammoniphilus resinae TaxID=861532 RepID=A0ABS4GQR7_9BACL|nr:parvulin-like peptidyl-prolyl isomerase [Ammoniphilus resinae]
MRNVKVLWGIIGCLILFILVGTWKYSELAGTRKVAVIGGKAISEGVWVDQLKAQYGTLVLNQMIDRQVVSLYAEQNGVSVTEEELDLELEKLQKDRTDQLGMLDQFIQVSKKDSQALREELRHYLLLEKIATQDIRIDDKEAYQYYEKNREKYNQPPLVRISAIYVNSKVEAEQVVQELKKGANFPTLAKERSSDIYSASSGGDLGWISLVDGDLPPEILDEAAALEEGQISSTIPLERGYAVIQAVKKKEAIIRTYEDVKDELKRELALNQVGPLENVLQTLKKGLGVQVLYK